MADHSVPHGEIIARTGKLQEILLAGGYDGALIAQKTDLFYFGGTAQQGWLYVPAQGRPVLMVFKEIDRARRESPLADVVAVSGLRQLPETIAAAGLPSPGRLGLELDVLPVNTYFQYQKLFPEAALGDISTEIRLIRAIKSPYEIDKIRAAAALADLVAARVSELLVAGKTEIALAGEVEGYARSLGHQGIVRMRMWGSELFYGHLLSGDAAAVPSYLASPTGGEGVSSAVAQGSGRKKIARHEPVLVDYVFALDGYLADHARIFSLGELAPELMAAHQAMLAIQEEVKAQALPGVVTGELYELMVARAEEAGYGESFMGVGERRIRFTGHGVGLELDEFPFIAKGQKLELAAGMVIALEPKTIFPGKGVVGIENTHLVTESGLKPLTKFPDAIQILP